ncbi:MAG: sulfite exporter TauE/SafE family protein [Candidatus Krumholzibacteriota bacterium]|nr:sulfite exporter TauE/SafE family protein [Candidatus Krumholzibacteriota bacterium]
MNSGIALLAATAASVGVIHTILGPDHYLPFVMMAKARRWPLARTLAVTALCGVGHVASSILIGGAGIALGLSLARIEALESFRGDLAAWALVAFGLVYTVWGIRRAVRNRPHTHLHLHADGAPHVHEHRHVGGHAHPHEAAGGSLTPWALFVVFVLGPCEPLIPILMYPAARESRAGLVIVSAVFAAATILTMTAIVAVAATGVRFVPLGRLERFSHAMAGGIILLSGLGIRFLGL